MKDGKANRKHSIYIVVLRKGDGGTQCKEEGGVHCFFRKSKDLLRGDSYRQGRSSVPAKIL